MQFDPFARAPFLEATNAFRRLTGRSNRPFLFHISGRNSSWWFPCTFYRRTPDRCHIKYFFWGSPTCNMYSFHSNSKARKVSQVHHVQHRHHSRPMLRLGSLLHNVVRCWIKKRWLTKNRLIPRSSLKMNVLEKNVPSCSIALFAVLSA